MQERFQLQMNGQELQTSDLNMISKAASLADDRVFAELLRMAPYTGSAYAKGIIPAGYANTPLPTVQAGTGSVTINTFRAVVGSRNLAATSPADNWQDIRSAVFTGATALPATQALAANASGNPRWDLVYATFTLEANGNSFTRYMKDVLSRVVTAQSLITTVKNVVTIGVVQGTAAASPVWPSLPVDTVQPDGRGLFYIPLAYVRVPNGFTSGSAVATNDIATVAPCLSLSRVLGGNTASWVNAGTATTAQQGAWGSSGTPPQLYASSAATGIETRLIAINLITGSESHTNGGIVDASQDWRGRLTRYTATAGTNASQFAWANPGVNITPIYTKAGVTGFGHTFITGTVGAAAYVDYNSFTQMTNGTSVRIFADNTTGALKVDWSGGAPNCLLIFAIDFFAPMR